MSESPSSQRAEEESDVPASQVHPLIKIIAENGGTLAAAYAALQRFLREGVPTGEELRRMRKERRKTPPAVLGPDGPSGPELGEGGVHIPEVEESKQLRPKMHALDPGIAELEALAKTLPWEAGIHPEEQPSWHRVVRVPPAVLVHHEQSALRKLTHGLLSTAAGIM